MENEEGCTIHLEVRIENDELVDKAILCPSFGGAARTFKACDGDGACYALLACMLCGNPLAVVQQTKKWKETWKRYGGRLRPTCFARERISRGLAAAPVTAPLLLFWDSLKRRTVDHCRGN